MLHEVPFGRYLICIHIWKSPDADLRIVPADSKRSLPALPGWISQEEIFGSVCLPITTQCKSNLSWLCGMSAYDYDLF